MTTEPNPTEESNQAESTANSNRVDSSVVETRSLVDSSGATEANVTDSAAAELLADPIGDSEEAERPLTPAEMDCYECRSCGYTYEPTKGDSRTKVPVGVQFSDLPGDWRCPVCGASRSQFSNVGPIGTASGFKENLGYGFGVNTLTPGQKNLLIFGALGIAVLFFLSLYGLR